MGIFSWLFSKNTENNSQVRKWVAQEMEKVAIADRDTYAIFVEIIHAAVQCGKDSIREQEDQLLQVSKQYLGDATIFEIVCYTCYRLEDWLVKNQSAYTTEITLPVNKLLVEKFYTALYLDQECVARVFKERLDCYKTMANTGKGLEEILIELEQRIMMSKGDKFNTNQLPQEAASLTVDSEYIKRSLEKYEDLINTIVIAGSEEYCKKNIKQQVSQNLQQNLGQMQGQQDYLFGLALVAQNDWGRACKIFTKVIAENPKHYEALVQRGLSHVELYHPADAERDFTSAIAVNPNKPAAYLHRAKCYHRNFRQKDKALADYCETIRLAPNDAAGYLGRGELYDDIALLAEKEALEKDDQVRYAAISKEFTAAVNDYNQVIALEPEHDGAFVNRALLYARKARATKKTEFMVNAIADFERAMSLDRTNGYLYKQQDDMQELLEEVRQVERQA